MQGDQRGVVVRGLRGLVEVGLGGVEALDARRGRQDQQGDPDDPHRQAHAVAAQDEPHQRPRAGERRARAGAGASGGAGRRRARQGRARGAHRATRCRRTGRRVDDGRPALELGELVAVVAQEQLLERRRLAGQAADAEAGEVLERAVELGGVDVEPGPQPVDLGVVDAGQGVEPVDGPLGLDRDRGAGQVAQLGRACPTRRCGPARMMLTRSHSASTSARMWLESSTVRPSPVISLMRVLEHRLHQRVEPRRRLVEDEQLGVGGERGHQRHLLAVALRVGAALLGGVELEALEQLVAPRRSSPPRSCPSRSITSPPDRLGQSVTSPGT